MNISHFVFASVISLFAMGGLHADSAKTEQPKKYYLSHRMIRVTEKGISIATKKGHRKAKTLRTDEKGVFVYRSDVCPKGDFDGEYPCCGCGSSHSDRAYRDACEMINDRPESNR